jgi:thioredoxin reductase
VKYDAHRARFLNSHTVVVQTVEGYRLHLKADTVIWALPLVPDTPTIGEFEGSAPPVYAIGDAREPALIVDAIHDGARVGRLV